MRTARKGKGEELGEGTKGKLKVKETELRRSIRGEAVKGRRLRGRGKGNN